MNTFVKASLGFVFAALALFSTPGHAEDNGHLVSAYFQGRVFFSSYGTNVKVVFSDFGITTLTFRVYDNALLDVSLKKGAFDGKPDKHPRVLFGVDSSNLYQDKVTLNIGSPTTYVETVGKLRLLPIYQTTDGHRIYYVMDSYDQHDQAGPMDKRVKFYIRPPAGAK